MAIKRMPIQLFLDELKAAWLRKDGYIMGATGQDPKQWSVNSWWFTQYDDDDYTAAQKAKALYWRKNAQKVWDCNGLAEGIYKNWSGVSINTKARYNYIEWCSVKGSGMIPAKNRAPGVAVFWGKKPETITHVAYLYEPVDKNNPAGDWYIIEAKGVLWGVVRTTLYDRKPNYWGVMDKYFDYGTSNNVEKPEVNVAAPINPDDTVKITGGSVNIRKGPGTSYGIVKVARKDDVFERLDVSGWVCIKHSGNVRWVSQKYVNDSGACTASSLNVRTGAGTKFASVGSVRNGHVFNIINYNGWIPIVINGMVYWVSAKYAE